MGLAAGVVAAAPASAAVPVVETMVEIKTPDGTCDAAFSHPTTGSHPAVIIWPDAFGLRPALREMGKRLAGEGYAVLVRQPVLPRRQGHAARHRHVQLPDRSREARRR